MVADALSKFVTDVLVSLGWLVLLGLGVGAFYLLAWLVSRKR